MAGEEKGEGREEGGGERGRGGDKRGGDPLLTPHFSTPSAVAANRVP